MENKRFAINIGVSLSGQLIQTCLTMLAIIGAVFVFILDKREPDVYFFILLSLSLLLLFSSIILGGKGINEVRKRSFKNKLKLRYSKNYFNYQAITCLFGVIIFIFSLLFTTTSKNKTTERETLNRGIEHYFSLDEKYKNITDSLKKELQNVKIELDEVKKSSTTKQNDK